MIFDLGIRHAVEIIFGGRRHGSKFTVIKVVNDLKWGLSSLWGCDDTIRDTIRDGIFTCAQKLTEGLETLPAVCYITSMRLGWQCLPVRKFSGVGKNSPTVRSIVQSRSPKSFFAPAHGGKCPGSSDQIF